MRQLTGLVLDGQVPEFKPVPFKSYEGKVVVACAKESEKIGEIWLTDETKDRMFTDLGLVVSSGCDDVVPGDEVIVVPYSGTFVSNCLGYDIVRFLGSESMGGFTDLPRLEELIMAKIEEKRIRPIKNRVLVRRDIPSESVGGILIPKTAMRLPSGVAEVLEVGPDCKTAKAGATVMMRNGGVAVGVEFGPVWEERYGAEKGCLAFISEDDIDGEYELGHG